MAGFKPQRKLYRLKFADPELNGLEVEATSSSMGEILRVQEMAEKLSDNPESKEAVEASREMMSVFARALRSWNLLDEEDQLVPTTLDGLLSQDIDLIMAIIRAWTEAVSGVSAPLDGSSPSGENALEAAMPMEVLSLSQVS